MTDDRAVAGPPAGGATESHPSPQAIRAQMERILADPLLEASPRRREMFRYLVEETLAGRADHLKGYTVALAVFGRDESFDPQSDPIVRIEARRLRSDLDGYYAGSGHRDSLRIAIPKGGYVPLAYWQDRPDPPEPPDLPEQPIHADRVTAGARGGARELDERGRARAAGLAVVVALLVVVASATVWLWRSLPAEEGNPAAFTGEIELIVLPFAAVDATEQSALLAQGLTQELISDLMRFSGLKLFSPTASFRQSPTVDPQTIGAGLGVAYVARGSVESEGEALRVVADLVKADSGEVLWSEIYDRRLSPGSMLDVRADISLDIASALGQSYGVIKTDALERAAIAAPPDMESYLCVLQAQAYRRTFDVAAQGHAKSCLEAAVKTDPLYAEAWAMLGWLYLDEVRFRLIPAETSTGVMQDAFAAASRAVDLDPNGVTGLQALASINFYGGSYDESEQLMRRAIELNPNDPDSLAQFGWRLAARGNFDEGIPLVERAIARSARPPGWYYHSIAVHQYLQGDYIGAIASAERSATNGSAVGWAIIAASQAALGKTKEAREAVRQMGEADPDMRADPAAVFRTHRVIEPTVDALVDGLRSAGWKAP